MSRLAFLRRAPAIFAACLVALTATAQVAVPALTSRVVDQTGTLSGAAVQRIEAKLADLETRKGSQIAVLVVPTVEPEDIEQFGIRVMDQWKIGRKNVDDGAILIVAKNDRRVRIEVGTGLEGALPDAIAKRIIDETITPLFKQGNFDGGVEAGVDRIIGVINGEPLPAPDKKWERSGGRLGNLLPFILIAAFIGSIVLRAMFGRFFGSVATGGVIGVLAALLTHVVPIALGAGVVGFLFALLSGSSSAWTAGGGWGGGGGFGGGGFGGGGGGFSGGGGGGSGGGASGGW